MTRGSSRASAHVLPLARPRKPEHGSSAAGCCFKPPLAITRSMWRIELDGQRSTKEAMARVLLIYGIVCLQKNGSG